MSYWAAGYVADADYVADFQREVPPAWVHAVATILGHTAPDITIPFRFADFGCGHGLTALAVAATMPHCEVWGFDFNPAFIASGRALARQAGLTNLHFEEASFADLARLPRNALPMFDYVSAHGVLSWISAENRGFLLDTIGQRLAPGGIVYLGYNVTVGWAAMRPVQVLMTQIANASGKRSDLAIGEIFALVKKMEDAGAALFRTHPAAQEIPFWLRGHDSRYLAHEFLNREWHPLMFRDVAAAMAEIKCAYIGAARPEGNFPGLVLNDALLALHDGQDDLVARETLYDLATAAPFRRELFQRGPRPLSPREHVRKAGEIGLARTFSPVSPRIAEDLEHPRPRAIQELCRTILAVLEDGPSSIGVLRDTVDAPESALLEAVSVLIGVQNVDPLLPGVPDARAGAAAARIVRLHASLRDDGNIRPYVALPSLGSVWLLNPMEVKALDVLLDGHPETQETLVTTLLEDLARTGRTLIREGTPVTDPAATRELVTARVRELLTHKLPLLRRLGLPAVRTGTD